MKLAIQADSHIGNISSVNEDSFAVQPTSDGGTLLLVCDGMGGMGGGDEASRMAVDHLISLLDSGGVHAVMRAALIATDGHLRNQLVDGAVGRRPGCTAVMVQIKNGVGWVAWAGDSRAYHVRDGIVIERTKDHKLVQDLIDSGQIDEEEAKRSTMAHVITQCLGGRLPDEPMVRPSTVADPWMFEDDDSVVLCSDGLCDLVEDHEIGEIVKRNPKGAVKELVQLALDRGGHDNITVVMGTLAGPPPTDRVVPEPEEVTLLEDEVHDPLLQLVAETTPEVPLGNDDPTLELHPEPVQPPTPDPGRNARMWVIILLVVSAVLLLGILASLSAVVVPGVWAQ